MVKGGSSYLSQSELPVTFGLEAATGRPGNDRMAERQIGRIQNLAAGHANQRLEEKGFTAQPGSTAKSRSGTCVKETETAPSNKDRGRVAAGERSLAARRATSGLAPLSNSS